MYYIRSQKRDDSSLGKFYISKHIHSCDIIYLSQHSFKLGLTMIIYPQFTSK